MGGRRAPLRGQATFDEPCIQKAADYKSKKFGDLLPRNLNSVRGAVYSDGAGVDGYDGIRKRDRRRRGGGGGEVLGPPALTATAATAP
jgi:hypothetical protein